MQVSSQRVKQQSTLIKRVGEAAALFAADNVSGTMDEGAIVEIAVIAGRTYADMSAALTADYYNSIRKASKVRSRYTAVMESGFDAQKTATASRSIVREVLGGYTMKTIDDLLGNLMERVVKDAADFCMRWNCRRDPARPRYAIVPNGDACAFCQMRAGLGYTYEAEDSTESHDHCTCTATPVFGNATIEGYDPKEYEDKYYQAAEAYRSGDISDDLREKIDRAKERHDARFEAEKAAKKWDSSNAILMVMREQQGIK